MLKVSPDRILEVQLLEVKAQCIKVHMELLQDNLSTHLCYLIKDKL